MIQPFENAKIYKEVYGHLDAVRHSARMPYICLLILTFLNHCISVTTKLGDFVNPGVLFLTRGSIVAYPIIYRLVPSPSRFEIRQHVRNSVCCIVLMSGKGRAGWGTRPSFSEFSGSAPGDLFTK